MRTTVTFEPDVAAIVEQAQRDRGAGVSAVVNDLLRQGAMHRRRRVPVVLPERAMAIEVDVTDVQSALDELEGSDRRW